MAHGKKVPEHDWDEMQRTDTLFVSEELKDVVDNILSSETKKESFKIFLIAEDLDIALDFLRLEQSPDSLLFAGACTASEAASIIKMDSTVWNGIDIVYGGQSLRHVSLLERQVEMSIDSHPSTETCTVTIVSRFMKPKQKRVL